MPIRHNLPLHHPCYLAIVFALLASQPSMAAEYQISPTLEPCGAQRLRLDGVTEQYVDAVTRNWLLELPARNPAILEMFTNREMPPYRSLLPWSGEFAGKYLTSLTEVARLTGDDRLREEGEQFVAQLTALQDVDGYLGPFPKDCRLTGRAPNILPRKETWDAWGHYHAMLGLLEWHELTGDPHALSCATKIGDLLCAHFLDGKKSVAAMGMSESNQAIVHSLALLYRKTGNERYLEGAKYVVKDFEAPKAGDYLRQALAGKEFHETPKPRWESLHALLGLAELYWITGEDDYRQAFEHYWWSIAEYDRHNNGGFSSGERAQGNPYDPRAIETCCTIAWMAMSVEMLKLTGNPIVADELELSTLNQVIGSYTPSGEWSTYNTPMDGMRVPSTTDIAFQIRPGSEELNCCSVNAARGFGMISDWALMRRGERGLVLNWYGPSEITTQVKDTAITLRQETTYPADGRVVLTVTPESPTEFPLSLRIPHWSQNPTVEVNGESVPTTPGTYATIDRQWKAGDKVKIDLGFALRYWAGERDLAGKTSVYRGPLLLAYESSVRGVPMFAEGQWRGAGSLWVTEKKGATVTFDFEGDSVEWRGKYFDDAGKSRVTIDGKELAIVDQYADTRDRQFVWKKDGLGDGPHSLTIETLGTSSLNSKGTWVNVSELVAGSPGPAFYAADLERGVIPDTHPGSIVTLEVDDTHGKSQQLRDFGTAGQQRQYYSWLVVQGTSPVPFSKTNPSRTAFYKDHAK
ncbi:beta-L-arabinofuranosidase domain-containing protein [Aeoliella sp. SH292]|uniref:beta-L-arabinofuranosidase domain-containing protein n=1 Tax=Aeoliella sp. SH292 TaxID=3454464 RepID=UPI003F982186